MPNAGKILEAERLSYPNMLPREVLIWKGWLREHEGEFDRYDYNVRVGKGVDPGEGYNVETRRDAILNSQKRIDCVARNGSAATIIEVEENPGTKALGQLEAYEYLWKQDNPTLSTPRLIVVCARANPDETAYFQAKGIRVYIVPTDFTVLRGRP